MCAACLAQEREGTRDEVEPVTQLQSLSDCWVSLGVGNTKLRDLVVSFQSFHGTLVIV